MLAADTSAGKEVQPFCPQDLSTWLVYPTYSHDLKWIFMEMLMFLNIRPKLDLWLIVFLFYTTNVCKTFLNQIQLQ